MGDLPSGTVTFLFTDVVGSTRLWAADAEAMSAALRAHDEILRDAIESRGGYVFTTAGDAFCSAFGRASEAVVAAESSQASLANADWPGPVLRVRMGLHLGEAEERGGDYFGTTVNIAARVGAVGHGGQVLVTEAVRLAAGVSTTDLGFHELRDVSEPVHLHQVGDGDFPALRVVDPASTNLPATVTSLIGRAEDLRQVREALGSSRLVTLTGGGGTGKTRLALAAGEEELPHRPDGVWFVHLTSVSDGDQVAAAVAGGLGLSLVAGDAVDQILAYVLDKDLLLIVDNCEHVIDECAALIERLVTQPGRSTMLATSRERLDVDGELALQVRPLSTDDDAGAVELFRQRAIAVDSTFVLTEENRGTVSELCRRLDGMPLAIELAAARSAAMSPGELLTGIQDRFRLLHGGRRRQRQRTLEATLDWSYDLLDDDEKLAFRALGVFVGTFDLDAVAVVGEVSRPVALDLIDSLIAKSLVVREEADGLSRFRLFETTAAYAEQRLADAGESAAVRDRHLDHYLSLAKRHPAAMYADLAARALLGADKANLVAGFEWAASKGQWPVAGRLLLGAFAVFYSHLTEGIELVDRCVEHLEGDDLAMVLVSNQWTLHLLVADFLSARAASRRLRESPKPLHQAYGYCYLAILFVSSDSTKAAEVLARAFEIIESMETEHDITDAAALCEQVAAEIAILRQDPELALVHNSRSLAFHHDLGFKSDSFAHAVMNAAVSALMVDDAHAAVEAANRYRELSPPFGTGDEIRALAYIALGDLEQATAAARAHARVAVTGRFVQQATDSILVLAVLANVGGHSATARDLVLNMGQCRTAELTGYARHFAEQLGIRAEFEANQLPILADKGDIIRLRAANDIETLRREMSRRGWH